MRKSTRHHLFACAAAALAAGAVFVGPAGANPAYAPTPPMGWNSWNHFADKVDDATIRAQADAMVASGMRDAGYIYITSTTPGKASVTPPA